MPSKQRVSIDVRALIAEYANQPVINILATDILSDPPLSMNNTTLNFLTSRLREYIKSYRYSATIRASEVKRTNLTVKDLIDLVHGKF